MSNERIDLTEFEDIVAAEESLNLEGANGHDMCDMVRTLITELKICYEEIDYLNALTNSLPIEMLVEADNKLQASE